MIKTLKISLLSLAVFSFLAFSGIAYATAGDLTWSANQTLDLTVDLTIVSGSTAESIVINAGNVVPTLASGDVFTISTVTAGNFTVSPTLGVGISCNSDNTSTMTITATTGQAYTISASATACVSPSSSGGGGYVAPVEVPVVVTEPTPELIVVPASSLNSAQITAIIALLQSFGAEADVIANVRASLEGGSVVSDNLSSSISKFTKKISKSVKSEVMNLQTALNTALGASLVKPLVVDGSWGRLTTSAIKQFQTAKGLDADGVVGPITRSALNTALGL